MIQKAFSESLPLGILWDPCSLITLSVEIFRTPWQPDWLLHVLELASGRAMCRDSVFMPASCKQLGFVGWFDTVYENNAGAL